MNKKNGKKPLMKTKRVIKVIHVHFMHDKSNHYFGSITAIFKYFSEEELDVTPGTLRHRLTGDGSKHLSSRACFIRSHLIRSGSDDIE